MALDQPTGPHVRLGILWAAVTLGALLLGPVWLAGWLAVVAGLAAGSAARSWGTPAAVQRQPHNRRLLVQPPVPVTVTLTAVVALSSALGGVSVAVAAIIVGAALVAGAVFGPLGQPDPVRRVLIVLGPALAASSLVLVRAHGLAYGLVLAGMVTVYDSSAFLIGTGAPNRWEGLFAGVASIAALTLFVAAVLTPPFTGSSPWLLGIAAAVLTPAGPALGRWLIGDPAARVPALRRLDSLLLLGPAWLIGISLLVRR